MLNLNLITQLVYESVKNISNSQSDVWKTNEWNICHHLAIEISKKFTEYSVDIEPVKDDRRRPDIVIHKRGTHDNNLVAFQVKIRPSIKDIEEDLKKIKETFFREPYNYKYGLIISIGRLPNPLPEFDDLKIKFIEVYGSILMSNTEPL